MPLVSRQLPRSIFIAVVRERPSLDFYFFAAILFHFTSFGSDRIGLADVKSALPYLTLPYLILPPSDAVYLIFL